MEANEGKQKETTYPISEKTSQIIPVKDSNKVILDKTKIQVCTACRFDLEGLVHIKVHPSMAIYCLRCFSEGFPKIEGQLITGYQIVESLEQKLFCKDYESKDFVEEWSLREEAQLLEGLQHCGFGNWIDISQKVGTKSKEQCEQHYLKFWWANRNRLGILEEGVLQAKGLHFKDFDIKTFREYLFNKMTTLESKAELDLIKLGLTKSKIDKFRNKLYPSVGKSGRKPQNEKKEEKPMQNSLLDANKYVEVFGFYPLRRDFDIEHDCEAENYIADMEFEGSL